MLLLKMWYASPLFSTVLSILICLKERERKINVLYATKCGFLLVRKACIVPSHSHRVGAREGACSLPVQRKKSDNKNSRKHNHVFTNGILKESFVKVRDSEAGEAVVGCCQKERCDTCS